MYSTSTGIVVATTMDTVDSAVVVVVVSAGDERPWIPTDTIDLVFKAMLSSFFVGPLEGAYTSSLNEQHVRHIMHQRPPIAVVGSFVTCNKLKHLCKYIYLISN